MLVRPPRPPFPTPNTLESLVIIGKITIENLRIRLDNPFYRCADPEILWCCFGFAKFRVSPPLFPPTTPLTSAIAKRHCKASSPPPSPFPSYSVTDFLYLDRTKCRAYRPSLSSSRSDACHWWIPPMKVRKYIVGRRLGYSSLFPGQFFSYLFLLFLESRHLGGGGGAY